MKTVKYRVEITFPDNSPLNPDILQNLIFQNLILDDCVVNVFIDKDKTQASRQELLTKLNLVFQTYPSHQTYLNDEKSIKDYKTDVRDGNKALMNLIDELAHEV